ncbi:uncharacterized protein LOC134244656 [Saccostrea cucullata]|uniref:uncharacterized protein LOC134244656 n=1 Tax=Saccostrea cuccullata TaxID=36930 RepID=UPI002ED3B0A3
MSSPRFYSCVLCSSRPKVRNRRPLTGSKYKGLRKFLQQRFLIESSKIFATGSVICNKCRLRCSREIHAAAGDSQKDFAKQNRIPDTDRDTEYIPSTKKAKKIPKSPPSITLPIPSVGGSHSQCAVCKRRGPKLVVVPKNARYNLFLEKLIVLPIGARCCPGHLSENLFHAHAAEQIFQSRTTSDFNRSDLMELITEIREIALRGSEKRIDFDSVKSLSDSDILTLTGITKKNLDELCSEVGGSLRDSSTRSVCTCIGIFLTKLKTGMPNKILCTLFNLGRDSIRRAIASGRKYLSQHFVPSHLGFGHISREDIISSHTRPIAQSLFGEGKFPAILVADGTYIYIQKS